MECLGIRYKSTLRRLDYSSLQHTLKYFLLQLIMCMIVSPFLLLSSSPPYLLVLLCSSWSYRTTCCHTPTTWRSKMASGNPFFLNSAFTSYICSLSTSLHQREYHQQLIFCACCTSGLFGYSLVPCLTNW